MTQKDTLGQDTGLKERDEQIPAESDALNFPKILMRKALGSSHSQVHSPEPGGSPDDDLTMPVAGTGKGHCLW